MRSERVHRSIEGAEFAARGSHMSFAQNDARSSADADQRQSPPGVDCQCWRDDVVALIPALRAFAWSLSHNAADADDLVQDTLIKAWTNREKFEPGTTLRAWLFTILRNTYYTHVIRRRREVRDEAGEYASTLQQAPTQDWSKTKQTQQTALQQ